MITRTRTRTRTVMVMVVLAAAVAGCTGGDRTGAPGNGATPPGTASPSAPATIQPADDVGPTPTGRTPTGRTPTDRPAPDRTADPTAPARKPVIGPVWISPALDCDRMWCTLPAGAGSVVINARVTGATAVEFFLVPTGTDTASLRRSIGVDRDGRDGWSVRWSYPDEPLMAHLTVHVRGPGGTAEALPFNLTHPEPLPMGPTFGRVWTDPTLSCVDGWCRLPAVAGTMTITAEVRGALAVVFWIDTVDSEPYALDRPTRTGDRYSVRWSWNYQYDARLRIVAGNNLGQVTVSPFGFRHV